jgi:GTP-binding protein
MTRRESRARGDVRVVVAEFEAASTNAKGLPPPTCEEVAFVGRSNVGKSSLMNTLVERNKLVRTSSTPGCTRQINLFGIKLADGRELRLVDLPGYGYAKLSKAERASWGERLEGYVQTRASLGCVVLLVDARRGFEPDDAQMAEFIRADRPAGPPPSLIVVATKIDKLPKARWSPTLKAIAHEARVLALGFSASTGEGRASLWTRILEPRPTSRKPVADAADAKEAVALASSGGVG